MKQRTATQLLKPSKLPVPPPMEKVTARVHASTKADLEKLQRPDQFLSDVAREMIELGVKRAKKGKRK